MGKFMAALAITAAIWAGGSACAMKPQVTNAIRCSVIGAEKLPAELGGAEAVCQAIGEATATAPGASVVVQVINPHMLAATATTADGRDLPEQRVATSDRTLHAGSLRMLAKALAEQLANAR